MLYLPGLKGHDQLLLLLLLLLLPPPPKRGVRSPFSMGSAATAATAVASCVKRKAAKAAWSTKTTTLFLVRVLSWVSP